MCRRTPAVIASAMLVVLAQPAPASEPVTLVREGRPEATIVVADEPCPVPLWVKGKQLTVAYAAEELRRWIEKSSGARLPVVPASKAS